jgi:hypothetical protein
MKNNTTSDALMVAMMIATGALHPPRSIHDTHAVIAVKHSSAAPTKM